MKDTPPWWWKLGWTLEEATPKPKPLMTSGGVSEKLKENTASKAESVVSGKNGSRVQDTLPNPLGFRPSKMKKGDW